MRIHHHKEVDYEEFASRFDNIRLDLEDIDEVFQIVKHRDGNCSGTLSSLNPSAFTLHQR